MGYFTCEGNYLVNSSMSHLKPYATWGRVKEPLEQCPKSHKLLEYIDSFFFIFFFLLPQHLLYTRECRPLAISSMSFCPKLPWANFSRLLVWCRHVTNLFWGLQHFFSIFLDAIVKAFRPFWGIESCLAIWPTQRHLSCAARCILSIILVLFLVSSVLILFLKLKLPSKWFLVCLWFFASVFSF